MAPQKALGLKALCKLFSLPLAKALWLLLQLWSFSITKKTRSLIILIISHCAETNCSYLSLLLLLVKWTLQFIDVDIGRWKCHYCGTKKKLSQPTGVFVLIHLEKYAVSNILVWQEERSSVNNNAKSTRLKQLHWANLPSYVISFHHVENH